MDRKIFFLVALFFISFASSQLTNVYNNCEIYGNCVEPVIVNLTLFNLNSSLFWDTSTLGSLRTANSSQFFAVNQVLNINLTFLQNITGGNFLRLDDGNQPTANYNWITDLTTTGDLFSRELTTTGETQLGSLTTDNHGINIAPVAERMITETFSSSLATTGNVYGVHQTLDKSGVIGFGDVVETFGHFLDFNNAGADSTGILRNYGTYIDFDDIVNYGFAHNFTESIGTFNDMNYSGFGNGGQYFIYGTRNELVGNLIGFTEGSDKFGTYNLVTGTGNNSYAGWFSATGATNNWGVWVEDGDVVLDNDNQNLSFGEGQNASITYNGTDFILSPRVVGSGDGYLIDDWHVTGNLTIAGNLNITGNITGAGFLRLDGSNSPTAAYSWTTSLSTTSTGRFDLGLIDSDAVRSIDINGRTLRNSDDTNALDWGVRSLTDSSGDIAFDWDSRQLIAVGGTDIILDYATVGTANFGDSDIITTGNINIATDSGCLFIGASQDGSVCYNGTNQNYDSQVVGVGDHVFQGGNVIIEEFIGLGAVTSPTELFEMRADTGLFTRLRMESSDELNSLLFHVSDTSISFTTTGDPFEFKSGGGRTFFDTSSVDNRFILRDASGNDMTIRSTLNGLRFDGETSGNNLMFINDTSGNVQISGDLIIGGNLTTTDGSFFSSNATCTFISSPDGSTILEVCNA